MRDGRRAREARIVDEVEIAGRADRRGDAGVGRPLGLQQVGSRGAARQHARARDQDVVAAFAVQGVDAAVAVQAVRSSVAGDHVGMSAAADVLDAA